MLFRSIKAIHFGKQEKVGAIVKHFSSEEVLLSERWVELPYQDTIPWNVEEVNVICDNGYEESYFITTQEIPIALHLTQENNKILIKSENPAQVPFLYTIKRNNRTIANGYGNELHREWLVRGQQIYSVKHNYLYGDFLYEVPISIESYIEVSSNKLSVHVQSAKRVTPGSKGEIQFTVTDTKGDGVKHADITACGVNAQLKSNVAPTFFLENKGVEPDGWYQDQYTYLELEDFFATFSLQEFMPELLDKEQEENLDFLYPSGVSIKQHVTNDSTTWIWAHVVENGVYKEPILFWIDNLLFATNIFGNSSREQFQITPGLHNLRFLIPGRMVEVENVPIEAGQRNLIIVNGNAEKSETIVPNSALPITTHSERNFIKSFFDLEQSEIEQVMSHFIEIKGAMGYIYLPHSDERFYLPIAIEYAGQYYHVNPYEKGYSEYKRNRDIDSYLVGPFPHLGRDHSEDLEITIYSDTIAIDRKSVV